MTFQPIFSMFFATLLFATSAFASPWADELKAKIDAKVQQHFKNNTQVGIVVGVVKGGETHFWSYGERIQGKSELPTSDTFFEMGSISKTYTATLLAHEVVKGKVKLSDPIKLFWPELKGTDAGEITLEQLATHHSGLPRMPNNIIVTDPKNPCKDYEVSRLLTYLKNFKQTAKAPFSYEYSNVGIGLLGYVLAQKLNGKTYAAYAQDRLLGPLKLKDTKTTLKKIDRARAAQGHNSFFSLMPHWDLNVLEGAGVLKTTASDLLSFLKFNMTPDSSDLGRAAVLAHQPRADTDNSDTKIGLAWETLPYGKHTVIAHSGATGGFIANLIFDPQEKIGAIALSNTDMSPRCILAPVFGKECEVSTWTHEISPEQMKLLSGTYHCEPLKMSATVQIENGFLAIQAEGQSKLRLFAKSDHLFEIPEVAATVAFPPSSDGGLNVFSLTQSGRTFEFKRKQN